MKRMVRLLLAVGFLCPLLTAQAAPAAGKAVDHTARLDLLFADWNRGDRPGGAVCVVRDGAVVYQRCFGLASLEYNLPNSAQTLFDSVSLAGPLTGMAAAMLQDQGKLDLDRDVRTIIPELPDFHAVITIRHLLTHASGLPDWLTVLRLSGAGPAPVTQERVLNMIGGFRRLQFAPGSERRFSHTNLTLLAEVVRRVSAEPFREWMRQNIFRPLEMTRTMVFDNPREVVENKVSIYNHDRTEGYLAAVAPLAVAGSHGVLAPIGDWGKWLLNLQSGEVGGARAIAAMLQWEKAPADDKYVGNYGWNHDTFMGMKRLRTGGQWGGVRAEMEYFPEQRFGLVVVTNWDYAFHDPRVAAQQIVGTFFPPKQEDVPPAPRQIQPAKVKAAELDACCGHYRGYPGQLLRLFREGDTLKLEVGRFTADLIPLSATEFTLAMEPIALTVKQDSAGRVTGLTISQDGEAREFPRIEQRTPTAEQMKEYVGSYYCEEIGARFTVALEKGALMLRRPESRPLPLRPEAADCFMGDTELFALVIFSRDAQGRVVSLRSDDPQIGGFVFAKEK